MNGMEKTQLQIDRGTRPIVENVDELRLTFGFDKIQMMTPIVETRLRSGLLAARDMKVTYHSKYGQIMITIPMGFPKIPLIIEYDGSSLVNIDENGEDQAIKQEQMQCSIQEITSRKRQGETTEDNENIYISAKEALTSVLSQLQELYPQKEDDGFTATASMTIEDDQDIGDIPITFYCCRRCRTCLFDTTALLEDHHGVNGVNAHSSRCTSLFVEEPPSYVDVGDGTLQEGKINCPKCGSRVGSWSWIGSQCSCGGEWIVPSYQFTKSKLDDRKE